VAGVVGDDFPGQGGGGAGFDQGLEVVQGEGQAQGGGDLEVGGVAVGAADRARCDVGVDLVEEGGEGLEGGAGVGVGGFVEMGREGDEGAAGLDREVDRDAEVGALRVGAEVPLVTLEAPPEELADRVLELLVAEALGLLDRGAAVGVGGEEGRVGDDAVEGTGDRAGALHLLAADLQCRHRRPREAEGAQSALGDDRHQVDALVVDPLEVQHQRRGGGWVRRRYDI